MKGQREDANLGGDCTYFTYNFFMQKNIRKVIFMINKLHRKFPICNGRAERAPHIGRYCFPLCWRCLSIIIGILLYTTYLMVVKVSQNIGMLSMALFLCFPCVADSFIQRHTSYVSTNFNRCLTGFLAGIGMRAFVFYILAI